MYRNVGFLHFILQEKDTYYVTAYDDVGSECGGYNRREIGPRKMRCFVTMGENLEHSPVSVYTITFLWTNIKFHINIFVVSKMFFY